LAYLIGGVLALAVSAAARRMRSKSMTPTRSIGMPWKVIFLATVLTTAEAVGQERGECEYRGGSEAEEGRTWSWAFPVGTKLRGDTPLDIDGDGKPELLKVVAEVQRDYAVNTVTGQKSERLQCWFRTRLEVTRRDGRVVYKDDWSTKYEDMAVLLETHGAAGPKDYFARFGRHQAFFSSGVESLSSKEAEIRPEAIEWSLAAQGIKGVKPEQIAAELSSLKTIQVLIYRAEWREDIRMAAYVPTIRRAVAIQVGY
jgi:hypothetical protein